MATDPGTLLAQANCYACFGNGGTWPILELALLDQWLSEIVPPTNLIPNGVVYNNANPPVYNQGAFVIGGVYAYVQGHNDADITDGTTTCTGNCTFTAASTLFNLHGLANQTVTAKVYRIS